MIGKALVYRCKTLLLLLFVSCNVCFAQTTNYKKFFKQLIKQEYQDTDSVTIDIQETEASIHIAEEGDPWNVSFSVIDYADFNNDSINDYIIHRNSEGMLGGNVKSNSNISYYIMENDSVIKQECDILLYAPFSYNIGDDFSYDKESQILTIHFTQNFRTYYSEDGLKETTKRFKYRDNNLYEFSYLTDCDLGQMRDKSIFKNDMENVDRSLSIDMHNYTELSFENFEDKDLQIRASISGCDNMNLYFDVIAKNNKSQTTTILNTLKFLANSTRYKSLINKAVSYIEKSNANINEIESVGLGDDWIFKLNNIAVVEKTNDLRFSAIFSHDINEKQTENWDITVRQK